MGLQGQDDAGGLQQRPPLGTTEQGGRPVAQWGVDADLSALRGERLDDPMSEPTRTRPGDQRLPDGDLGQIDDQSLIIEDLQERRQLGISRYGQAHRPFNGRDTLQDLYDEQLDLLVYLRSIKRASEADRGQLINAVTQAMQAADGSHSLGTGQLAEVAVDRIMSWVVAARLNGGFQ